jgi:hypothetical protein
MKIYIPTSDNSNHILPVFAYLLNKYWEDHPPVCFLGFSEPSCQLSSGFSFTSIAPTQEGGIDEWTTYLNDFFSSINDEHFIFACDDHFIVRQVDVELYNLLLKERTNPKVGRIDLTPSFQLAEEREGCTSIYKEEQGYKIIILSQSSPPGKFIYKITGQWSIWNRKYFLQNMPKHWNPAQWEVIGGKMAENDCYEILGTADNWCVKKTEGLSGSQFPGKINIDNLMPEDIQYIKTNNLYSPKMRLDYVNHDPQIDLKIFGHTPKINEV